jgi:hypothetical protein
MADDKAVAIHPEFPRWYRTVDLSENRERLGLRYRGVLELIKNPTPSAVESMIRVAFRSKQAASPENIAKIRKCFKGVDDFFDMTGNDRELEILCGAGLALLLEKDGNDSADGAVAVTTTAMNGARSPELPMDLSTLAEQAICRIGEIKRKRPSLGESFPHTFPKIDFTAAKAKIQEQPDAGGFVAAIDLMAESLRANLAPIKQNAADIEKMDSFVANQDEELQILWWLFGKRSVELNCLFTDVTPAEQQPIVFAKELADATQFLPGPTSAKALLAQTGLKDRKKITIPGAVNACTSSWLSSLAIENEISPVSSPVHFAIVRKLETDDDTKWIPGWEAITGIEQKFSLSTLALGNLFYRERLLILFSKE